MIEFFLLPANIPFVIALAVMLAFTFIEILSASMGMGLSDMVDSIVPEFDADIDIDADMDMADGGSQAGFLTKLLAWFRVGEVPVVMLFIVFLTGFGLSGLTLQFLFLSTLGAPLPRLLAVPVGIFAAIPTVRICGGILGKYMPKDETYVVSEESFQGMVATITLGIAAPGRPSQAKLKDKHGQTHYILVEPDNPEDSFSQGEKTIIVSQNGAIFRVIDAANTGVGS